MEERRHKLRGYFVSQVKCPSFWSNRRRTYECCRPCLPSAGCRVSGQSLEQKNR